MEIINSIYAYSYQDLVSCFNSWFYISSMQKVFFDDNRNMSPFINFIPSLRTERYESLFQLPKFTLLQSL